MNKRPILMQGQMVRTAMAGTKTLTRRTTGLAFINENPSCWQRQWVPAKDGKHWLFTCGDDRVQVRCPYGVEGDQLYVRETFSKLEHGTTIYQADGGYDNTVKWKPGIHLPRLASRLLLEITSVRLERLQDISLKDAAHEGMLFDYISCRWWDYANDHWGNCIYSEDPAEPPFTAIDSFKTLWESIHGRCRWSQNPWVWVLEFKKIGGYQAE